MKILVTGGLGFIGSHLVDRLIQLGNQVSVLDGLKDGSNISFANSKAIYYNIDLKDKSSVWNFIENNKFDQIYHLASESHVDRAIKDPQPFIDSNITGTYNLFSGIIRYQPTTRVLLFSTDEVMGELESGSFKENDPTLPKNMYSMTKQAQEAIARSYYYSDKLQVVTSRCSNIYGPRQSQEKFLPTIISSIQAKNTGKRIPIYGDGKQVREWTYVSDAVEGAIFIMKHGNLNDVYHIGSSIEKQNLEVVKFVIDQFKEDYSQRTTHVEDRKGHDKRYSLCVDKLNKMGWKSKIQFEEGIKETIKWFKDNQQ